MKNIKYISLFMIAVMASFMTSCIDDSSIADDIAATSNVLGFVNSTANLSGIADGSEYTFKLPVAAFGPSTENLSGAYTATVSVDPSSTAIEGTHFRLDANTISVDENNNLLGDYPITMLTEGIVTPLAVNPVLVLSLGTATGSGNIVASGKKIRLSLLYLCPSDLSGNYITTLTRNDGNVYVYPEYVAEIGIGEYRGESVGYWAPGSIGGTPGFDFTDVCSVISVPRQNLVDLYSNEVFQSGDGFVNEDGSIQIEYTVTGSVVRSYVAVYVPQ